ncbi:helix-turn-helix transcriptional regulator [Leminorella grimontii]|uniref:helix-turn-helix transcriptional regulator n=1 Tax=Leminorella grimontii TaxID=82981 RepID=UPI00321F9AF8
MHELTPKDIVQSLIDAGFTQNQIADAAGVAQSSICRLLTGVHTDPRLSTVRALEKLYSERIVDAKKA